MLATLFASTLLLGAVSDGSSDDEFRKNIGLFQRLALLNQMDEAVLVFGSPEQLLRFAQEFLAPWVLRSDSLEVLLVRLQLCERVRQAWAKENDLVYQWGGFRPPLSVDSYWAHDAFSPFQRNDAPLPSFGGRPAVISKTIMRSSDSIKFGLKSLRNVDKELGMDVLTPVNKKNVYSWNESSVLVCFAYRTAEGKKAIWSIEPRVTVFDHVWDYQGGKISGANLLARWDAEAYEQYLYEIQDK
jgi:hypothetical protein